MILPFSTQLNKKPTYFPEKIISGLYENKILSFETSCEFLEQYVNKVVPSLLFNKLHTPVYKGYPKIHTIRQDQKDRWNSGVMIDFFINARQKNMFRFAPRIPVVSIQEIFMTRRGSMLEITIAKEGSYIGGDDFYIDAFNQGLLAANDGFDQYDDFRNYFINVIEENGKATGNYWFKGKIIHWTDFKY